MNKETVQFSGINLVLSFTVSGKYYPATQYDPAEYPEAEIHEITLEDSSVNIYELFKESDLDEIYESLNSFSTY
jgi:hypothetical protein